MYFVKALEDVAGMVSMKTHFKCFLGLIGVFDTYLIFIVEILYAVQKGSGSTLNSMPCQTFSLSPSSSNLVYLCPNL